ncbi:MAG: Dihydropteroate synthase [uncultured Sphingomonadaceae bacterium]|uniref:dihydropteroate synthase n=1 Tax=uncultured Sphingomonadaceae bacterium TaxID=169976 RepID=A0A6J4U7F4_9SPHN|nr:MAG: Dihydropteroate synthase [uncultured Sphingomonadaceae bacterium]
MKTYLRPTGFVDAPFGYDGRVARLAGGLLWFSAVEWIVADAGRRVSAELVPVAEIEARLDGDTAAIWARLTGPRAPLRLGERVVRLDQPQVVGILNATPDSFSDGGAYDGPEAAANAGADMAAAGAAIVDVGGESTRPGAKPVWEGDEIARVRPVIERLARGGTAVSVDTRKAVVMRAALEAGAGMVNDVSGLSFDPQAAGIVAEAGCPVVIMHMIGTPETMNAEAAYGDVLLDVYDQLEARVAAAEAAGIARDRIVVDPGIGFAKTLTHNLRLLGGLALFHGLGCAVMLGASRKRMIGALADEAPAGGRLGGSLALALKGAEAGVQLHRVHDVRETVQALKVWRGMRDVALTPG